MLLMDRLKFIYRFQFNNHQIIDDDVKSQIKPKRLTIIDDINLLLVLGLKTRFSQFNHHCFFINGFQQSRAKHIMHLHSTSNDIEGDLVDMLLL